MKTYDIVLIKTKDKGVKCLYRSDGEEKTAKVNTTVGFKT